MQTETYTLGLFKAFPENYTGSAIVLLKTENIPPHLGLLHNGLYYSLSVKGVKTNVPLSQFTGEIRRSGISCVMVEIEVPFYIESPERYFLHYTALHPGEDITCLFPIREWLGFALDEEEAEAIYNSHFVFELIDVLRAEGRIGNIYAINVNKNELVLPKYTRQDIANEIKRKGESYA